MDGMTLRVRFAETDQMGIAHHGAYVVWFEVARVEWLRQRGVSYRTMEANGTSMAVAQIGMTYRTAAYFDDELQVACRLTQLKSRYARFEYRVLRESTLVASGFTEHVPTNKDGRAIRLEEAWFTRLKDAVEAPFSD